jgi:hypothetical protein
MAREKAKKDIIINGVTYKGIQLFESTNRQGETTYDIDTAGVSTIIRQFIKNNYGDIKNWVRSRSFAGGSAVDVYLWNVPDEWYGSIKEFADSFGKYHEYGYDGGDGYWRGRDAGATLPDGTRVRNFSPYMDVSNTPPWDAKERNMTPPDYTKSMPKKSSSGFKSKFSKESKTAGFELVYNCGNGWKVYEQVVKREGLPNYRYRVVKNYDVKPVDKDKFYALKGDMLDSGFSWSVKAQCFERFYVPIKLDAAFFQDYVCNVLNKYFGVFEQPKSEVPTETHKEDLPSGKIPIKSIRLHWDDEVFTSFHALDSFLKVYYYENSESKLPTEGYDKYKIEFIWEDGSRILDRIDVSIKPNDYNPFRDTLSDYMKKITPSDGKFSVFYEIDLKTDFANLSFEDMPKSETTPSEMNLDQYIDDMQMLVELETDEEQRLSLLQYVNDLQTLKMLG